MREQKNRTNIFDIVFLILIFILLLGGALTKLYNNPIVKVFIPLLIFVTCIYQYRKKNISNYLKFCVFITFIGGDNNQYILILVTIFLFFNKRLLQINKMTKYLYLFLGMGFLSYILNQFIEVNILSFFFFFMSFFLPIIFYFIGYQVINKKVFESVIDFYIKCVFILVLIALFHYYVLGARVDQLTGGTNNAHVLGFHSAVAFLYLLSKLFFIKSRKLFLYELLLIFLIPIIIYLADAKYILVNLIVAFLLGSFMTIAKSIFKPIALVIFAASLLISFNYIKTQNLRLSAHANMDMTNVINLMMEGAKYQLLEKTFYLPKNEPLVFLIGSGPGTFLSRAANSRAYDLMNKKIDLGGAVFVETESNLPSFIPPKTSWITKKYASQYFNIIWGGTLFNIQSSLMSLFWEFGIIGFAIFIFFLYKNNVFISFYSNANLKFKYKSVFIKNFILFYIFDAFMTYYFEYPKCQILFWLFLGLIINKTVVTFRNGYNTIPN